jgi:hypothetical protein
MVKKLLTRGSRLAMEREALEGLTRRWDHSHRGRHLLLVFPDIRLSGRNVIDAF